MRNGKQLKLKGDNALTSRPMNNTINAVKMHSPTGNPTKSVKNSAFKPNLFLGKKDERLPLHAQPNEKGVTGQPSSNFASSVKRTDFTKNLGGKVTSPGPGAYMPEAEPKKHALSVFPTEKR